MQVLSVTQFVTYLNETFKAIWDPTIVALEGEVTGFRISQGQWVNFDVKDEGSLASVFMVARNLSVPLQDGMRVRLYGVPRVYPKYGKFSFSADRVELVGEGALKKALELLRAKLEAEGMFDVTRKRELTKFPQRIALIASRESAAYGDFIRIVNERWSGLEIDLYHVLVQGADAPESIVSAIVRANRHALETPYDALILTRGGGSMEELMAFNDERVVRALYASKIPTLVGIGHERDVTLAEEVADVRGSTPTDCARRLVPDKQEMLYQLASIGEGIGDAFLQAMDRTHQRIDRTVQAADHWTNQVRNRVMMNTERAHTSGTRWLERLQSRMLAVDRLLQGMDPRAVLRRGYAIVRDSSGRPVMRAAGLRPGAGITLELQDATVDAAVLGGTTQAEQARLL